MRTIDRMLALGTLVCAALVGAADRGTGGVPSAPDATATIDGKQLPPFTLSPPQFAPAAP